MTKSTSESAADVILPVQPVETVASSASSSGAKLGKPRGRKKKASTHRIEIDQNIFEDVKEDPEIGPLLKRVGKVADHMLREAAASFDKEALKGLFKRRYDGILNMK